MTLGWDEACNLPITDICSNSTPSEILTNENIRTVYRVDADILDVGGRPHVILNDSVDEMDVPPEAE